MTVYRRFRCIYILLSRETKFIENGEILSIDPPSVHDKITYRLYQAKSEFPKELE